MYREAAATLARDEEPFVWALVQTNLGIALTDRIRGRRESNLDDAISSIGFLDADAHLGVYVEEVAGNFRLGRVCAGDADVANSPCDTDLQTTTGTVTVNAAFLQEIKEVNQELWTLLADLRHRCQRPIAPAGCRYLIDKLSQFRDQLALHFDRVARLGDADRFERLSAHQHTLMDQQVNRLADRVTTHLETFGQVTLGWQRLTGAVLQ